MSAVAPAAPTTSAPVPQGQGGSSVTVAVQMFGADFLKLRKKRSILIWALVLALAPIVIIFVVEAIQHASDPAKHEPAGGLHSFHDGLRLLGGLFFGPLVAILIGVEAGTGDASAGVFRDLVVTGRSTAGAVLLACTGRAADVLAVDRLRLRAACVIGTFVFAGDLATPDGA